MNAIEILGRIKSASEEFESEAVDEAILHPEEITQPLLDILEIAVEDYIEIALRPDCTAHLYAIHILTELHETDAHPTLLELCRLPPEVLDSILGEDFIDGRLSRALAATSGGYFSGIADLLSDDELHEGVRIAALRALVTLVAFDEIDRDEVIECLGRFFREEFRESSRFWDELFESAAALAASEIEEDVKDAWRDGLIDEDWEVVEESLDPRHWQLSRQIILGTWAVNDMSCEDWWAGGREPLSWFQRQPS